MRCTRVGRSWNRHRGEGFALVISTWGRAQKPRRPSYPCEILTPGRPQSRSRFPHDLVIWVLVPQDRREERPPDGPYRANLPGSPIWEPFSAEMDGTTAPRQERGAAEAGPQLISRRRLRETNAPVFTSLPSKGQNRRGLPD